MASVVSHSSLRPCKEPHRGAAHPHCAATTIPELTHLSSSSTSELRIYVRDPTGREEDWMSRSGFVLWLKTVVFCLVGQFIFIKGFCYNPLEGGSDLASGRFGSDWVVLQLSSFLIQML